MIAEVTREEIAQRINDWQQRLNALYSIIQTWLPADTGYVIDTSGLVTMNEEMMRQHNMPAVNLPTMKIVRDGNKVLYFEPKGLWVIGANGRVDVFGKENTWILVDVSDRFASETKWKITEPSDRRALKEFSRESLLKMLAE